MTTKRDRAALDALEEFALSLPEAWPDTPWGDRVVKVGKKIFVFISSPDADRPAITTKLPESREHAMSFREVLYDFVEES